MMYQSQGQGSASITIGWHGDREIPLPKGNLELGSPSRLGMNFALAYSVLKMPKCL